MKIGVLGENMGKFAFLDVFLGVLNDLLRDLERFFAVSSVFPCFFDAF